MENKIVHRSLDYQESFSLKQFFFQWEWMLVLIFLIMMIVNSSLSPYFLDFISLTSASGTFLDKGLIVLPMVLIILLGEIDISVASILALASVVMAVTFNMGLPLPLAMILCVVTATFCGFINGYLVVKFSELSSVIITLATMIIFRGFAYVILEDQAAGGFPDWFSFLGWGSFFFIPFILPVFVIFAIIFYFILHRTVFGRVVYAVGGNQVASFYSGLRVKRTKIIVFTVTGFMVGVTALFLSSRLGSTRPNIALGYELDVIAMVVLGGVSTAGGKGRMLGAIIAIFLVGYLRYGLGLVNIASQALLVVVGLLLIFAVLVPNLSDKLNNHRLKQLKK